jgi:hypothetical protein
MINKTGKNLTIIIQGISSWTAFASWYSINRHLPDATVVISKKKSTLMNWPHKANVRNFTQLNPPYLVLPPYTMAIRPLSLKTLDIINKQNETINMEIFDCREQTIATFVTFKTCGKFDLDIWEQHETRPPIFFTNRLRTQDMSINESKIINLWFEMQAAYEMMDK